MQISFLSIHTSKYKQVVGNVYLKVAFIFRSNIVCHDDISRVEISRNISQVHVVKYSFCIYIIELLLSILEIRSDFSLSCSKNYHLKK